MDVRAWLRSLPTFDREVPGLDLAAAPHTPNLLHLDWIQAAADAGVRAPHAVILSTASRAGVVSARSLILKDIDGDQWVFATSALSPKAQDLADNPRAALTSWWSALGRQVRIKGTVRDLGDEVAAADYRARPDGSRAAAITGTQSEPLDSIQTYDRAFARARESVTTQHQVPATWRCYAVTADLVEFWAARPEGGQVRLQYTRTSTGWQKRLVWP